MVKKLTLKTYIRALRLPFISASLLPFIFGSFIEKNGFLAIPFILGMAAVVFMHLGANLLNDYADSKSGADWHHKDFYGFFGGSKLIQQGVLSEKFYLRLSIVFFVISFLAVVALAFLLKSTVIFIYYFLILFLGFSYSHKPLSFSYRYLGEFMIFILFGPAIVQGAYFIQTKVFPTTEGFLLSLPFGLLTAAILISNEVPDYAQDKRSNKRNLVTLIGPKNSFIIYIFIVLLAFASIALNIIQGYLSIFCVFSFLFLIPAVKAASILKNHYENKTELLESSKLTIAIQGLVSLILTLDIIF